VSDEAWGKIFCNERAITFSREIPVVLFTSQLRQAHKKNTIIFTISYSWVTSCQQLFVGASISAIVRLYPFLL